MSEVSARLVVPLQNLTGVIDILTCSAECFPVDFIG